MDFAQLPIGFAMALAENTQALERFGQLSQDQRQVYLDQARQARSRGEMHRIVSSITGGMNS